MTITLFDIPSTNPGITWSPNTWKTRYCLNYKAIPYKTQWVELPDLEPLFKKLGIAPTGTNNDGSPRYTVPAIHDPSTNVYIADSFSIAEYMEKTYPDTPKVFPHNTCALQAAFTSTFEANIEAIYPFIIPEVGMKLNPPSAQRFRRMQEEMAGKKLEELIPQGERRIQEWAKVKAALGNFDASFDKNGGMGPFIMGKKLS